MALDILHRLKQAVGKRDLPAAAAPYPSRMPIPSEDAVIAAIRQVYDPEIPVNVYDLGLIYRIAIDEYGSVEVDMTLTAPACPVAGTLPGEVRNVIAMVPGVIEAEVNLVWDPPWSQEAMSEEAQLQLGLL